MQVTLKIERIIKDIQSKSHLEVASVADPASRYRIEAGTEKLSEIKRDIAGATSTLIEGCYRFLDRGGYDETDDSVGDKDIVIKLLGGTRRFDGKEKSIAQKLHEIIVDLALEKFYVSVSQADLSRLHQLQAASGITELERLLRRKRPPKYLDR